MARELRRLTAQEFDLAASDTQMTAKNVALTRQVMVDGLPVSTAAERAGITHQAVSGLVARVWTSYRQQHNLPADWRRVSVVVPQPLADQIEVMAAEAANELRRERLPGDAVFSHERKRSGSDG